MQGGMNESAENRTIIEIINDKYTNRPPIKELADPKNIKPTASIDTCIDRIKSNGDKFMFYYATIILALDLVFVISHRLFAIPIAITVCFLYLFFNPTSVKGFEILPLYSAIACVSVHILICLILKSMSSMYVYFFALNAAVLLLIIVHGAMMDTSQNSSENQSEAI